MHTDSTGCRWKCGFVWERRVSICRSIMGDPAGVYVSRALPLSVCLSPSVSSSIWKFGAVWRQQERNPLIPRCQATVHFVNCCTGVDSVYQNSREGDYPPFHVNIYSVVKFRKSRTGGSGARACCIWRCNKSVQVVTRPIIFYIYQAAVRPRLTWVTFEGVSRWC